MDALESLFSGDHTTDYLKVWKFALIQSVRSDTPDFTNRQLALLLIVYLEPGPHTVRGLAAQLSVAKPVITRALNTLEDINFVKRKRDMADRRNLFVQRTVKGAVYLSEFAEYISQAAEEAGKEDVMFGKTAASA
ncbi:MAG: MarR family transcriptional regulator [Pseudomonadota bacterium]